MEDLKAYIESGILELYALGDVTQEERLQVEEMALKHPAVKAELDAVEASLENYAMAHAIEPSAGQRDRILNSLLTNLGDDRIFTDKKSAPPAAANKGNVVALQARQTNFYKYAFAACLALLIVSVAVLVNVYNKLQDSYSEVATLQAQSQKFSNRVNLMDHQLGIFRDPSFKFIKLKGTPKAPLSIMTIAWSAAKKKVMIDMAGMKLPENDKSHQYQLWAIVAGKPVDLGVFDAARVNDMIEMKPVEAPQAFAVTLEPRGGSVNPTKDQMVVISNI